MTKPTTELPDEVWISNAEPHSIRLEYSEELAKIYGPATRYIRPAQAPAEMQRLKDRITFLEGQSGYCAECERRARGDVFECDLPRTGKGMVSKSNSGNNKSSSNLGGLLSPPLREPDYEPSAPLYGEDGEERASAPAKRHAGENPAGFATPPQEPAGPECRRCNDTGFWGGVDGDAFKCDHAPEKIEPKPLWGGGDKALPPREPEQPGTIEGLQEAIELLDGRHIGFPEKIQEAFAIVIEAAQRFASPSRGDGWQTMETAPRDGSYVVLHNADQPNEPCIGLWDEEKQSWCAWYLCCYYGPKINADKWMPIPPTAQRDGGE